VPRLADFLRAQPEVRIELDLSDRLSSLAMEGFDLAIRHTAAPPDTHVAWTLCETRSVLVASRAYLRRRGTPRDAAWRWPRTTACITRARRTRRPGTFERAPPQKPAQKPSAPRITVPVSGPLVANNSEALRDAALTGLGIALVPDFSAQSALQSGKLVEVLPQWRSVGAFGERLYAIRPYATHVPQAVTAFVAWLREALGAGFAA
jgi:DNA-binding transcriptional LysR family regulator